MNDKEEILKLEDGQSCYIGHQHDAQVWLNNGTYFLFEVHEGGCPPSFVAAYSKNEIVEMIETIRSWT